MFAFRSSSTDYESDYTPSLGTPDYRVIQYASASGSSRKRLCLNYPRIGGHQGISEAPFRREQVRFTTNQPFWLFSQTPKAPSAIMALEPLNDIWKSPIEYEKEADIESAFMSRIKDSFAILSEKGAKYTSCTPVPQYGLANKSRLGLFLKRNPEIAPVAFEIKKSETLLKKLFQHAEQIVSNGKGFFAEHLSTGRLIYILTDGNTFYLNYFYRLSLADFAYDLYGTPFRLYDDEGKLDQKSLVNLFKALYVESIHISVDKFVWTSTAPEGNVTSCPLKVDYFLASGGSSSVYMVSDENSYYALKVGKMDYKEDIDREISVLKQIKDTDIAVPMICSVEGPGQTYIVSALGCPAKKLKFLPPAIAAKLLEHGTFGYEHFLEILRKLKSLHEKGFVHRDLRLENFILINDHAYLNDFGCALPKDHEAAHYGGSIETASSNALDHYINGTKMVYRPIEDLESVFKCFILWRGQSSFKYIPGMSRGAQARNFWKFTHPTLSLPEEYEARYEFIVKLITDCIVDLDAMESE